MRYYNTPVSSYFQYEDLSKQKREFKINYIAIKREFFNPKSMYILKNDPEYHRKVNGRTFRLLLIDRLINQVDKARIFQLKQNNKVFVSNCHFLEYLELLYYTKKINEELLDYELSLKEKYKKGRIEILDTLIEQLYNTKEKEESREFLTELATNILLDIIYITRKELDNKDDIQKTLFNIEKYTRGIGVLWTIQDIDKIKKNSGRLTEIEKANHNNIYGYIDNELHYICHFFKLENNRYIPKFNINKVRRFKEGYKWGYCDIQTLRHLYILILINYDEVIKDKIIEMTDYFNKENNLWKNYKKFLTYFYNDLYRNFENNTLQLFKSYKQNNQLNKFNTSLENITKLPYYETFKGVVYLSCFDMLVSEQPKYKNFKDTYIKVYDKRYRDNIRTRYLLLNSLLNFDQYEKELDLKNNKIPLTKFFNVVITKIPNINDKLSRLQRL